MFNFKPNIGTDYYYYSPNPTQEIFKNLNDVYIILSGNKDVDLGELVGEDVDLELENLELQKAELLPIFLKVELVGQVFYVLYYFFINLEFC